MRAESSYQLAADFAKGKDLEEEDARYVVRHYPTGI